MGNLNHSNFLIMYHSMYEYSVSSKLSEFELKKNTLQQVPDFASQFISKDFLESKPLKGLRVGVICETLDDGVDPEVISSIRGATSHLEELGCTVTEVFVYGFSFPIFLQNVLFSLKLPFWCLTIF